MEMDLRNVPTDMERKRDDVLLFSESNSRFVVEVDRERKEEFEKTMAGVPFAEVGKVTEAQTFQMTGLEGKKVIDERLKDLKEAWQATLRW